MKPLPQAKLARIIDATSQAIQDQNFSPAAQLYKICKRWKNIAN